VSGRAEDADAAGGVLDDGEDDQPCSGEGAGVEEVGRRGGRAPGCAGRWAR
jgi:hypothetical protein